jgi:hypothetical protein
LQQEHLNINAGAGRGREVGHSAAFGLRIYALFINLRMARLDDSNSYGLFRIVGTPLPDLVGVVVASQFLHRWR